MHLTFACVLRLRQPLQPPLRLLYPLVLAQNSGTDYFVIYVKLY